MLRCQSSVRPRKSERGGSANPSKGVPLRLRVRRLGERAAELGIEAMDD
jgi:hypothetical protein